jgi:hypothetical protein
MGNGSGPASTPRWGPWHPALRRAGWRKALPPPLFPAPALSPVAVLASHLRTLQGLAGIRTWMPQTHLQTLRGQLPSASGARLDAGNGGQIAQFVRSVEVRRVAAGCES